MYEIMWKNVVEPGRPQMANHMTQERRNLYHIDRPVDLTAST